MNESEREGDRDKKMMLPRPRWSPHPPTSPSLISLVVSVDVKHPVSGVVRIGRISGRRDTSVSVQRWSYGCWDKMEEPFSHLGPDVIPSG